MSEVNSPLPRRLGPPFTAPEGQSATFLELFFDLVFVFALTEVTALTLEHLDWEGAAHSLLIFWMIWWAWTQWTWALNPADTEHSVVRIATLVATAVAFIMAASVSQAFEDAAAWFALSYVAVRAIGLVLYLAVASEHPGQRDSVRQFALASIPGMIAVVAGGFVDSDVRVWVWLVAVVLDVAAALYAARSDDWDLHVDHFAERHGLFVIIALGESLIVVGTTVAHSERTGDLLAVAIGAVTVTCLLWWTYFGWLKDALEHRFEHEPGSAGGVFGRDVYSLIHFPLIGGVIGIAIGFEEMALHPDHHLETAGLVALALGLTLFVGSATLAWARATRQILAPRLAVLLALIALLFALPEAQPVAVLAITATALAAIAVIEQLADPVARVHAAKT